MSKYIGSVEVGKIADLVLWEPPYFGVKPHLIIKGGMAMRGIIGDANASIQHANQLFIGIVMVHLEKLKVQLVLPLFLNMLMNMELKKN